MRRRLNQAKRCDNRVSISSTREGIKEAIEEALENIGGLDQFVRPGERVFVKPNLTGDRDPSTGAVTNPEVVKAIIELIQKQNPDQILLGDSPSWGFDSEKTFDVTGARRVAEQTGCTLVDLDRDERVACRIEGALRLKEAHLARTVLECDRLINVPVMKTHMQAIVTLGLKNMKGLLPLQYKTRLHELEPGDGYPGLDIGISDLHKLIQPDLTVIDATLGMEGRGPFDGEPVRLDAIIAGEDPVLVDAVGAAVMGFDPESVPSIKLCAENDGTDMSGYRLMGLPIDSVKRTFKPCPTEIYEGENIRIFPGETCSGCLGALNTAIFRLKSRGQLEDVKNLTVGIGKNPEIPNDPDRVLYVGTCAPLGEVLQSASKVGIVEGCPPTGWKIAEGMKKTGEG